MNNKYMRFAGLVLIAASFGLASCDKDNDVDGTLEKVELLSEITIEKTIYHTGDQSMSMLPGQEIQMNCVVGSPDALNKNYVWTSSDETVASITPMGYLITKKAGETVISVTPEIGFGSQGATPAVVLKVVDSFMYIDEIDMEEDIQKYLYEADNKESGIWQNQSYQVTVSALPKDATFKRYKWESDNEDIVTVNQEGVITGVGAGTATIKVTADDFSINPATYEFKVNVKAIVEIEGFEFKEDGDDIAELSALGYGQEIDMNTADVISFDPEDATPYLLKWSSSNSNVVSITEDGKLKVNTTTGGTAELTATYNGISKTKIVTVAEGRLWYSFGNGITPWSLESNHKSSVFESKDGKTTIKMGTQTDGTNRGDIDFVRSKVSETRLTPKQYPILAMKIKVASNLVQGIKTNGCIKLEILNDADNKIWGVYKGIGDVNTDLNSFSMIDGESWSSTEPNVIYFNLPEAKYTRGVPTDWNQTFIINQLKFVIADYPSTVNQYDIYWVRSFKTIEELEAYVASENATNETE